MNVVCRPAGHILAMFALACFLAGCGPSAKITVNKAADISLEPKRLFVLSYVGNDYGEKFYDSFQERLAKDIRDCGAEFAITTVTPVELDSNVHLARLNEFHPDAVLSLRHPKGTIGTRQGPGPRGAILNLIYEADLIEMPAKKTVWKANIDFKTGDIERAYWSSKGYLGEGLADQIVGQLAKDAILRSCPAPKQP
jgi:hypothetical protein